MSFSENWFLHFYQDLIDFMQDKENNFTPWGEVLEQQLHEFYVANPHGDMVRWQESFRLLPNVENTKSDLTTVSYTHLTLPTIYSV